MTEREGKDFAPLDLGVPIPNDPAERAALYDEAGLTPAERLAMDQWVRSQTNTKDPLHLLTNEQWDELHADLAEMARRRRRAEAEAAWIPMA